MNEKEKDADIVFLTEKLSQFGIVEVIKNDYVFTLYMRNDTKLFTEEMIPFKVLGLVNAIIVDKPIIEVFKNESNFLILVLKPKQN